MIEPIALSPNRSRALRYDESHLLIGLGARSPQVVGPFRPAVINRIVAAGALTRSQWATAFRGLDARAADALRDAVTCTLPPDLRGLDFAVHGCGPVAVAIAHLLDQLGATANPHLPMLGITVGAPGARLGPGVSRLIIELGPDQIVVGPLLQADAGPCEGCLNARRHDLDRRWERLRPQVLGNDLYDDEPTTSPELAHVAVGFAGLVARGLMSDNLLPIGSAMSVSSSLGRVMHHVWPIHPLCVCQEQQAG